jgi:hypothetical protein
MNNPDVSSDAISSTDVYDITTNEIFGVDALPFAFPFHIDLLKQCKMKVTMKKELAHKTILLRSVLFACFLFLLVKVIY